MTGIEFYAQEIREGRPFSMVRYGDGEWHAIVPDLPPIIEFARHPDRRQAAEVAAQPEVVERLSAATLSIPRHPRFLALNVVDLDWGRRGRWGHIAARDRWMRDNGLDDLEWLDGSPWSKAVHDGEFHLVVEAMRGCGLPLVFVGPARIARCILEHFEGVVFIPVHHYRAPYDIDRVEGQLLALDPAFVSLSAGHSAKIIASELFPLIGESSYLVDFGAVWDGLCGHAIRPYMGTWQEGSEIVRRAWGEER